MVGAHTIQDQCKAGVDDISIRAGIDLIMTQNVVGYILV